MAKVEVLEPLETSDSSQDWIQVSSIAKQTKEHLLLQVDSRHAAERINTDAIDQPFGCLWRSILEELTVLPLPLVVHDAARFSNCGHRIALFANDMNPPAQSNANHQHKYD